MHSVSMVFLGTIKFYFRPLFMPDYQKMLFLILTASNEIYDDCGDAISIEKMTTAANSRAKQVAEYGPEENEDDIIARYKKNPEAKYTTTATLVNLEREKSTLKPNTFFIKSYRTFVIEIDDNPLYSHKAN